MENKFFNHEPQNEAPQEKLTKEQLAELSLNERLIYLKEEEKVPVNIEKLESMPTIMSCLEELRDGDILEAGIDNKGLSHFENAVNISKVLNVFLQNFHIQNYLAENEAKTLTNDLAEEICTAALYHDAGKVFDGEQTSELIKDLYNVRDLTVYGAFPVRLSSVAEHICEKKYKEYGIEKIAKFKSQIPKIFPERFKDVKAHLEKKIFKDVSEDYVIDVLWNETLTMRDLHDYHAKGTVMALEKDITEEEDLLSFEIGENHHILQSRKNLKNYSFFNAKETDESLLPYLVLFEFVDKIEAGLLRPARNDEEAQIESEKAWDEKISKYIIGANVKLFEPGSVKNGEKIKALAEDLRQLFFNDEEISEELRDLCVEVLNA